MVLGSAFAEGIQSIEEWLEINGYDAESTISEEDLISIQLLITSPLSFSDAKSILISLSLLSSADIELIKMSNNIDELKSSANLSNESKMLVNSIQIKNNISTAITVQERITFHNGVRHDWRLRGDIGSYEYGVLIEKDPGEKNIMDHNSFYLQGNTVQIKWFIGDHQLTSGYGLITWRSVSPYKSFDALQTLPRYGKGTSGYRSSNEYWSTRGVSGEWGTPIGNFIISLGHTPQDGSINDGNVVIDMTGMHISQSDLKKQDRLIENVATIVWNNGETSEHFGFIINTDVTRDSKKTTQSKNVSTYVKNRIGQWDYFGEIGLVNLNDLAMIGGALHSNRFIKYLISYRSYPQRFRVYRAQPFSEWGGMNDGETGIFHNLLLKYQKHSIAFYQDMAVKNELSQNSPYDEIKNEFGVRWKWRSKKHWLQLQYRKNEETLDETSFVSHNADHKDKRVSYKGLYHYKPTDLYNVRWQINVVDAGYSSVGYGLESRLNMRKNSLSMTGSWIISKIDNYNSRVYFWDINLPGEMRSIAISESAQLLGVRLKFKKDHYQICFRTRYTWNSYNFSGTTDNSSAFSIQINF